MSRPHNLDRTVMRAIVAVLLAGLTSASALAQAIVPAGTAPNPGTSSTANLIFDAMLAAARAAATNPLAAPPAQFDTNVAIQRYHAGDINGARSAAIQALIEASRAQPNPIPVVQSTIPQTSYLQTRPFPLPGGSVAAIDADAFVAQARGAVIRCRSAGSPNAGAAAASLSAAERDAKAGQYHHVRIEARAAIDLCAQATQANDRR